jgi:hypothetical protein
MIEFQRDDELASPGRWQLMADGSATITCPKCGSFGSLAGHSIAADGKVTPSLVCPWPPCTFHDWGRLNGWPGGSYTGRPGGCPPQA